MGDSGDFIFARRPDGGLEFRGDFEGLYKADPDPWGQSGEHPRMKEYYAFSRANLVAALKGLSYPADSTPHSPGYGLQGILEVGCGAGYVVDLLSRALPCSWFTGIDISASAVDLARKLCPHQGFAVGDFATLDPKSGCWKYSWYSVIILSQVLWYVMDQLPGVFKNTLTFLRRHPEFVPRGYLVIQMAFLDNQEYGREIVDGFNGLLRYVLDHYAADFQVVSASYDNSSRYAPYHDGLLVLQATR